MTEGILSHLLSPAKRQHAVEQTRVVAVHEHPNHAGRSLRPKLLQAAPRIPAPQMLVIHWQVKPTPLGINAERSACFIWGARAAPIR